jgi:phage terminase large subunit-like protein
MLDFDDTEFRLTEDQKNQRDLAAGPARHVLAFGGSRSGKTFGYVRCVSTRALMAPTSRHLICRLHNIDVRQAVMMDTFPSVMRMCFPGVKYKVYRADQFAVFDNDAEVWFGGLDDKERVDKILGKEYATIYPNEVSQIPFDTIVTLRTRLAQKVKKIDGTYLALKAYYDLNPTVRMHWTYKEFVEGVRPDNGMPLPEGSRAWLQMNPEGNPHLPPEYLEELEHLPERQRLRFKEGQYLSEVPGTLWPVDVLDACRVDKAPPLRRIVVAVDPSGSDGVNSDMQAIVVAGTGYDGKYYVLADKSCKLSPSGWGRTVVSTYHAFNADCVVAESNFGGDMVRSNIQNVDPKVKVKLVRASRGKHVRAEPIAGLYEDTDGTGTKVHHVGRFSEMEDQMSAFTTNGYSGSGSPDRADALVWALTELTTGSNYDLERAVA